jgi:phosphohistidine phosphatase SixA
MQGRPRAGWTGSASPSDVIVTRSPLVRTAEQTAELVANAMNPKATESSSLEYAGRRGGTYERGEKNRRSITDLEKQSSSATRHRD